MQQFFDVFTFVWNGLLMRTFTVYGYNISFGGVLIFCMFAGLCGWFIGRIAS